MRRDVAHQLTCTPARNTQVESLVLRSVAHGDAVVVVVVVVVVAALGWQWQEWGQTLSPEEPWVVWEQEGLHSQTLGPGVATLHLSPWWGEDFEDQRGETGFQRSPHHYQMGEQELIGVEASWLQCR